MNLFKRLQSALPGPEQSETAKIFELVYGRMPGQDEMPFLDQLSGGSQGQSRTALLRAVINGYDHQRLSTPFTVRFSQNDIEFVAVHGVQLALDKADQSVSAPIRAGWYEPHLIKFYRDRLKPGMTFVDIGANIGLYSMLAAQQVGNRGKVICFEPNSENCRLILLSAQQNKFTNVTVFPVALGDKSGYALFSTGIGSNGILLPNVSDTLLNSSCLVVPLERLESLVHERIDFIKIDVEGAEGLALKGAQRLLEQYRPVVTSEFSLEMLPRVSQISGTEYLSYFTALDYDIFLIERQSFELQPIPDVAAFINNYGQLTRIEDLAFVPH